MDLVKILEDTVTALPAGEYTSGLTAILRHISAAIRHFEGLSGSHGDRFTDAVYRTNQAYEGSLKEAYRVLAELDPTKKTPHEIEEYLEQKEILRPRVLTQITRYRHDYRNPSTHDYKLDFDQSEALLAITSTCGFAKLLIDQISEKIAFNNAILKSNISPEEISNLVTAEELAFYASKIAKSYLEENQNIDYSFMLTGAMSGRFSSAGYTVNNHYPDIDGDMIDIVLNKNEVSIPIEVRCFQQKFRSDDYHGLGYLAMIMEEMNFSHGINVIHANNSTNAPKIIKCTSQDRTIFVVTQYEVDDVKKIGYSIDNFQNI